MSCRRLLNAFLAAVAITLATGGTALASGGNYVFDGGTASEQQQVRAALAASSFNWSVVPGTITIHITPSAVSEAVPGAIYLDPALLDSGQFSWGVVQHEYAHEVDFALFDDATHAQLNTALGGTVWCYGDGSAPLLHSQYGCERFASTLAWAYWQSPQNSMNPAAIGGESGGMGPAAIRALITTLLGSQSQSQTTPAAGGQSVGYAPPAIFKAKVVRAPKAAKRAATAN